jgi:hypothetical protein
MQWLLRSRASSAEEEDAELLSELCGGDKKTLTDAESLEVSKLNAFIEQVTS